MSKKIGGYFELELENKEELYREAIRLNSGRSCLEYILLTKGYKKVYLPFFSCNSLLDVIKRNNVDYEFYSINDKLHPYFHKKINPSEVFLYINFFGLNNLKIDKLKEEIPNIIVDNSQAFFSKAFPNIDTFYSPRKFFGVPDGGYLFTNTFSKIDFPQDYSVNRSQYLLLRIDNMLEQGYNEFGKNEELFSSYGIRVMSHLSRKILRSIDYDDVRRKRNKNFSMLHHALKKANRLKIHESCVDGALVYPFLTSNGENLRKYLISQGIFCATYWKEVEERVSKDSIEINLVKNLVNLPIDQRYGKEEMDKIINLIEDYE